MAENHPIEFVRIPAHSNFRNLNGMRFGKLAILGYAGQKPRNPRGSVAMWWCRCDCGTVKTVNSINMISGNTRSCGCGKPHRTHGHSTHNKGKSSPEYNAWRGMKDRCCNTSRKSYKNYGGRGIAIYDRWLNSFEAFLEDMGPMPQPRYTLERIDNSKGYEPGNCRWASRREQNRNKRGNHLLTYQGETLCLTDWAAKLGISPLTLSNRINRSKWPVELALSLPVQKKGTRPIH